MNLDATETSISSVLIAEHESGQHGRSFSRGIPSKRMNEEQGEQVRIRVFDPVGAAHRQVQRDKDLERAVRRMANNVGSWFCPGKCGRRIAANKSFCLQCADKNATQSPCP